MEEFTFEELERNEPLITINVDYKKVYFNKCAYEKFNDAKFLNLYYDITRGIIAFEPVNIKGKNSYTLTSNSKAIGGIVCVAKLISKIKMNSVNGIKLRPYKNMFVANV